MSEAAQTHHLDFLVMALKEMVGTVVSDKMQKTVVVAVEIDFHILSTKKLLVVRLDTKLMMQKTIAKSETGFELKSPLLLALTNAGRL